WSPGRVASAVVLQRDTTARQIILQARAVDELVDLVRTAPTRCKRAELGAINAVLRHLNSWSERGEVQEVSARSGERLDLLRGHVGGYFGRPHLYGGRRLDCHGLKLNCPRLERE